jgi:hypothetical protein
VRGRLFPVDPDWCEWLQEPPLPGTVLVRVVAGAGGRLVLAGLRIDARPTAELLRSIPVGRIEAAANAQLTIVDNAVVPVVPVHRPRRRGRADPRSGDGWETTDPHRALARPGPPLPGGLPRRAGETGAGGKTGATGAGHETGARRSGGGARLDWSAADAAGVRVQLPPAEIGAGQRGRPDSFYRDVAHAYRELAQSTARPAAELAEVGGVPVTTAHRWIKEARRRGFLPPGRPGRAG